MPTGEICTVKVPVQSGFTEYVPARVTGMMLPFWLTLAAPAVAPFPSKVCVPTIANGPASGGGLVIDPVLENTNVPFNVALEHSLSFACALGARPTASTAVAVTAKSFAMVVRFMIILLRVLL